MQVYDTERVKNQYLFKQHFLKSIHIQYIQLYLFSILL
jgi:hypothetical protein